MNRVSWGALIRVPQDRDGLISRHFRRLAQRVVSPSPVWGQERSPSLTYFPMCDIGPHAYLKKKFLVYAAFGAGLGLERHRLRFCAEHIAVLQEDLAEFEVSAVQDALSRGDSFVTKCLSCGEPVREGGRQLFVTCYPTQDERKDYWSRIHDECSIPAYLTNTG